MAGQTIFTKQMAIARGDSCGFARVLCGRSLSQGHEDFFAVCGAIARVIAPKLRLKTPTAAPVAARLMHPVSFRHGRRFVSRADQTLLARAICADAGCVRVIGIMVERRAQPPQPRAAYPLSVQRARAKREPILNLRPLTCPWHA